MISENDLKALKGASDKQYKFTLAIFIFLTLLQLFYTYDNVASAIAHGQAMGLDIEGVLAMWNSEPELNKHYSGHEVQSLHRLNMGIISFGTALLFAISTASMSIRRNRNKRVLNALKECGVINA